MLRVSRNVNGSDMNCISQDYPDMKNQRNINKKIYILMLKDKYFIYIIIIWPKFGEIIIMLTLKITKSTWHADRVL